MVKKRSINEKNRLFEFPLLNAIGYEHFDEAKDLNWHQHPGFELTFVTKRSVSWELEDHGVLDLVKGNVSTLLPNVKHRGRENIIFPCDMLWMGINTNIEEGIINSFFTCQELGEILRIFRKAGNSVTVYSPMIDLMLDELKKMLVNYEVDREDQLINPTIRGLICQIIVSTAKCFSSSNVHTLSNNIEETYRYIKRNYQHEIDISHIAKKMEKSESYLYAAFKEETGQTPNELIVQLRIKKAIELLRESDQSITYIAMETGFSTSQYFSSVFKRQMGRSPRDFRNEG